jgi:hypothetical protein
LSGRILYFGTHINEESHFCAVEGACHQQSYDWRKKHIIVFCCRGQPDILAQRPERHSFPASNGLRGKRYHRTCWPYPPGRPDIFRLTVRPDHAGGVDQVLKAFRSAKERVSVDALLAILREFHYQYLYHRAIDFYMQRAAYRESTGEIQAAWFPA